MNEVEALNQVGLNPIPPSEPDIVNIVDYFVLFIYLTKFAKFVYSFKKNSVRTYRTRSNVSLQS